MTTNKTHQNKRKIQQKRKTQKRVPKKGGAKHNAFSMNNQSKSNVVKFFLEMLNTVKLFHWKTKSYPQHKATDELYESLSENIDKFMEVMMGKDQSRVKIIDQRLKLYDFSNISGFKEKIFEYRDFLIDLTYHLDSKKDTDLLNIRDELLGDINQFLYLLSLDKLV